MDVRPIDANALMEFARNHVAHKVDCNDIARFPTLDYEPVRHSQWQLRSFVPRKITVDGTVVCPECGQHFFRIVGTWFKRCPECGAIMDGGKK